MKVFLYVGPNVPSPEEVRVAGTAGIRLIYAGDLNPLKPLEDLAVDLGNLEGYALRGAGLVNTEEDEDLVTVDGIVTADPIIAALAIHQSFGSVATFRRRAALTLQVVAL